MVAGRDMLNALRRDGAVELDGDDALCRDLARLSSTHTSAGWSARVKRHLRLTRSLSRRIRASQMFAMIRDYLGDDAVIFDVQQIYGGRRRQVCHRDHGLGPGVCATLAMSDCPLRTRIYTSSHRHDRDMDRPGNNELFVDIETKACVYDTYAAHRGPAEADTRNRFFIECCVPAVQAQMSEAFGSRQKQDERVEHRVV